MIKTFNSAAIKEEIADRLRQMQAIEALSVEESRELADDEVSAIDEIMASIGEPAGEGKKATGLYAQLERATKFENLLKQKAQPVIDERQRQRTVIKPVMRMPSRLRLYKNDGQQKTITNIENSALWFAAAVYKIPAAIEECANRNIDIRQAQTTTTDSAGGYLTPTELSDQIIRVVNDHSVIFPLGREEPMMSDKKDVPKRTGGLTVQYPNEAASITKTDPTWDDVNLVAVSRKVLTRVSNELNMEAAISVMDNCMFEIGQAFGERIDVECIDGDGTSSYGSVTGLENLSLTGSVTGAGNTFAELTMTNFNNLIGALPDKHHRNAVFIMRRQYYANSYERLVTALGGTTMADAEMGPTRRQIQGYPVYFTSAMPAEANSATAVYFGNFDGGMVYGNSRGIEIASSEHSAFDADALEVRGVFRYDIKLHDTTAFKKLVLAAS